MKLYDAITAGITHLQQNRLRAGLSILGTFIGIASVLCMITIGDGAKKLITNDIAKLGGPNQVQFWICYSRRQLGKLRRTTERYTLADADAIESESPQVIRVLSKNSKYPRWVHTRHGTQIRADIDGVTADYASGIRWKVQQGRFLCENDVDNALQVCVLGANVATELFGGTSPLGQEVKISIRSKKLVRCRVVGVMASKGNQLSSLKSLDNFIYVPLTTHQQRLSGKKYVERLIVFFQKDADVERVIDNVKVVLRKRHRGKMTLSTIGCRSGYFGG